MKCLTEVNEQFTEATPGGKSKKPTEDIVNNAHLNSTK